MKRPIESDYKSQVAYTRALEAYCDTLAQPAIIGTYLEKDKEQEPVAWVVYSSAENDIVWTNKGKRLKQNTPLYTTPPQRKPLTDEDLRKLADKHLYYQTESYEESGVFDLSRAIEAAHGIKE